MNAGIPNDDPVIDPLTDAEEAALTLPQRLRARIREHALPLFLVGLLLVFAFVVLFPRIVITVRPGHEGVMWKRLSGTQIDTVYTEGTHLIWPWNVMYIYELRLNRVDAMVPVLSTDGLEIDIDVSIRYRPVSKSVPQLHKEVGPDYVNRIIVPEVVTAVREVMGKYRPEQLYTLRTVEMQREIVSRAALQVQDRFVIIDDVLIKRIVLPTVVQAAIQSKLRQEQEALEYAFRLDKERAEAERKRIEAGGIADFQRIVSLGLTPAYLNYKGIEATLELSRSPNSKVVVVGSGPNGLPLILNTER